MMCFNILCVLYHDQFVSTCPRNQNRSFIKHHEESKSVSVYQELIVVVFVLQAAIRKELNEFKSNEMEVHASSKHLTRSVCVSIYIHGLFLSIFPCLRNRSTQKSHRIYDRSLLTRSLALQLKVQDTHSRSTQEAVLNIAIPALS